MAAARAALVWAARDSWAALNAITSALPAASAACARTHYFISNTSLPCFAMVTTGSGVWSQDAVQSLRSASCCCLR